MIQFLTLASMPAKDLCHDLIDTILETKWRMQAYIQ